MPSHKLIYTSDTIFNVLLAKKEIQSDKLTFLCIVDLKQAFNGIRLACIYCQNFR